MRVYVQVQHNLDSNKTENWLVFWVQHYFLFFFFSSFLAARRSSAAALEKTFIGFPTQNFALVFSYLKIFFICRFSYLFFFFSLWGWEFDDIIIVFSFLFINFHRSWKKRKEKLEYFTTSWHIYKNFPPKNSISNIVIWIYLTLLTSI